MDLLEARQPRLFDVDGPLSVASSSSYRSYRSYRSYDSRSSYRSSRRASHDTVRTEADDISTKFEYLEGPISRAASPMLDPENRTSQVSVASCASTVSSRCGQEVEQVTAAEEADFDMPDFHLNDYCTESVPTTPVDFGKLFPSTKKLCITHDDSVLDGNMNLKIITAVRTPKGRMQNMTLFHLRMYDLRKREFSLRRYDRDSGREVAHTVRKYQAPSDGRRPILQRSLSSAFSSFRSRTDSKASGLARVDSHSTSHKSLHTPEPSHTTDRTDSGSQLQPKVPTNTTRLEFSNYAQVEIKRRGTRAGKRYEFEYWGTKYQWRRKVTSQDGQTIQTSFQLVQAGESVALANIVPEPLSPVQQHEEAAMGRWVPPCAMWISDQRLIKHENDVSDVVVASGLMALVDDCIKNRFHDKKQSAVMISSIMQAEGQHLGRVQQHRRVLNNNDNNGLRHNCGIPPRRNDESPLHSHHSDMHIIYGQSAGSAADLFGEFGDKCTVGPPRAKGGMRRDDIDDHRESSERPSLVGYTMIDEQ